MMAVRVALNSLACTLTLVAGGTAASLATTTSAFADGNQENCGNNSNSMSGTHIVACGIFNESGGNGSSSAISLFGYENQVTGNGGIQLTATGNENKLGLDHGPLTQGATAVGSRNSAVGDFSTAVGYDNITFASGTTAVGLGNEVGNPADQTASVHSSAFGSHNIITGSSGANPGGADASLAVGENNFINGNRNVAIGNRSGVGDVNSSTYSGSFAAGYETNIYGNQSIAVGYKSGVGRNIQSANNSVAIGAFSSATSNNSVALGEGASTTAVSSVAIGSGALVEAGNSVALGAESVASAAHTNGPYTINGGSVAGSTANGVVSVGHDAGFGSVVNRQIQNVAAGIIDSNSTDAVNGSQLYAVGSALNNAAVGAASGLGGGAGWNAATGAWTAPSYNVNETIYNNVGSAVGAVNTGTNNLGTTTAAALGGGATYTAGAGVTAPNYVVQGKNYNNVGSALGAVDSNLNNLNNSMNVVNQQIGGLWQSVGSLQKGVQRGYEGSAVAIAHTSPTISRDAKFGISGKWGNFRGQNALGVMAQARINNHIVLNASVGAGLRYGGVGLGAGGLYEW